MAPETDHTSDVFGQTDISREWLLTLADDVTASGTDAITVRAPATDTAIGSIPACDEDDVADTVKRARDAQSSWADTTPDERAAVLERFADLVMENRTELLDLLQLETGKSRQDGVEEVFDIPVTASYYADTGPAALADEARRGAIPPVTTATVTYEPVGVVGIISPWNYPLTLSFTDAIPALMAGNAVVLKPDEKTPFIALALASLLREAGLPDDALGVVTGRGDVVGPALIDRIDYLSFTGGTDTGRIVAEQAGRNLIDCSLELGGKNPLVVLDDADVAEAARGAVQACFTNAGQLCLAAERLYVHESVYEEFLDEFVAATRRLSLGTDHTFEDDMGSLIDAGQLERVQSHVENAVESGATLLTGGRHRPDVGPYCYEPTILTDVDTDSMVACEETFGPVVSVEPVSDADEAIEAANDTEYGLNASVWTGDTDRGAAVAREIDCGTVCVNDGYASGWAAVDAPMGGFGDSGLGRRHGHEGIERYLESRTVATSRIGPVDAPPGIPDAWYAKGMFAAAQLLRYTPSLSGIRRWFR
jgi:succinate-semialdehyde dehydrogenase/glutarate-semialdehyde dehydrogenase